MTYLICRNGNYYYNRQVPSIYRDLDPRNKVRISLNTDSKRIAWRKAVVINDEVEAYWQSLVTAHQLHDVSRFGKLVHIARQMGFSYLPMSAVINLPPAQLCDRVIALSDAQPRQIDAVLGGKAEPSFLISESLEKYWGLIRDRLIDKSPDQIRKWKNPRKKAVRNFIDLVGDKDLKAVTRTDTLAFRNWWLDKIESDGIRPSTANKDLIHLKDMVKTVSKHFGLKLKIRRLFDDLMLNEDKDQTRLPFSTEQILNILEHPKVIEEMDEDARWLVAAMAETGARNTEIIGLLPEDIVLNHQIPHISIIGRKGHKLKTKHSRRIIPLVGYALEAFKAHPKGFPSYRNRPDHLTNKVNRFLRENNFFPSQNHSLYSLRHSFQDRLTLINPGERVQTDLMGHKFPREKYGHGTSLDQKNKCLMKIRLKR